MAASESRATRFFATALVIGALGSACEIFVSFAIDAERPIANEAGAESSVPVDAGFDPCGPVVPPRPILSDGNVGDDTHRIVFAGYTLSIGSDGGPESCPQPGLNLDNLDSKREACGDAGACRQYDDPGNIFRTAACDSEGGVDNALLPMTAVFVNATAGHVFTSQDFDVLIGTGAVTVILALDGYNETDTDDDVTVNFFGAAHLEGVDALEKTDDQLRAMPRLWDGGQLDAAWVVDQNAVDTAGIGVLPKFVRHGYVSAGELVVEDIDVHYFSLPHISSVGRAKVQHGIIMAQITREDGRWKLVKGRFAGGYSASGLLATLGAFRGIGDLRNCDPEQRIQYETLRTYTCAALDLPADLAAPDPNAYCGAMSMGFTFASIESHFAFDQNAHQVVGPVFSTEHPLCPDDAGTVWCDDCAWEGPRRCNDAGVEVDAR